MKSMSSAYSTSSGNLSWAGGLGGRRERRCNCLLLHGVPESSKDTTEAAIAVFNSRLDLNINN